MGLCMEVKKTGDCMEIGYGGYFAIRRFILNEIEDNLGETFSKECIKGKLSEELIQKLIDLKIDAFILHSDCDGTLKYRDIKKALPTLMKFDYKKNMDWRDEILELIKLFKIAVKNNSSIKYY